MRLLFVMALSGCSHYCLNYEPCPEDYALRKQIRELKEELRTVRLAALEVIQDKCENIR